MTDLEAARRKWVLDRVPDRVPDVVLESRGGGDMNQVAEAQGIRAVGFGPQTIRFVTHLDVDDAMITRVAQVLGQLSA